MRRFDRVVLDYQARKRAADGSLVVPGRFARTGLQAYRNEDGSDRIEYRPPDAVSASAPTFEGVAITDLHPTTMVDAANWRDVARGHVQGVSFVDGPEGESWLEGSFHVKALDLIDAIERGERPELSAGYFCDEVREPGEYKGQKYHCSQAGIVGNHVASIPSGTARAGREARLLLDSTGNQAPPWTDGKEGEDMAEHDSEFTTLATERDGLRAKVDSLAAEVDALKAKLSEASDPGKLEAAVKARVELVDRARKLGGPTMDTTGSDRDIRARALEAVGVKTDGRSDAYVEARLDAEIERMAQGTTIAEAVGEVTREQREKQDWLAPVWAARDAYLARLDGDDEEEVN